MEGRLIPIEDIKSKAPLRIRGVGTEKAAVVMFANYTKGNKSKSDVKTQITFQDARPGQNVIDLETGELLGTFSGETKSFPISIKQYKGRLLYIGPRKDVGIGSGRNSNCSGSYLPTPCMGILRRSKASGCEGWTSAGRLRHTGVTNPQNARRLL